MIAPISGFRNYNPNMQVNDSSSQRYMGIEYYGQYPTLQTKISCNDDSEIFHNIPVSSSEISDFRSLTKLLYTNFQYCFDRHLDAPNQYSKLPGRKPIEQFSSYKNKKDWILPTLKQVFPSGIDKNFENDLQSPYEYTFWDTRFDYNSYFPANNIFEFGSSRLLQNTKSIGSGDWYELQNINNMNEQQYYNMKLKWIKDRTNTPKTQVSDYDMIWASASPTKISSSINVPFEVSFLFLIFGSDHLHIEIKFKIFT